MRVPRTHSVQGDVHLCLGNAFESGVRLCWVGEIRPRDRARRDVTVRESPFVRALPSAAFGREAIEKLCSEALGLDSRQRPHSWQQRSARSAVSSETLTVTSSNWSVST